MKLIRPVPRTVTGPLSVVILVAWVACMAVLVNRSYLQASPANLATDLARYGPTATWRGVYYRGEKIGFTVSQTIGTDEGFELRGRAARHTLFDRPPPQRSYDRLGDTNLRFARRVLVTGHRALKVRGTVNAPGSTTGDAATPDGPYLGRRTGPRSGSREAGKASTCRGCWPPREAHGRGAAPRTIFDPATLKRR